jgi:cytochrome b
LKRILVWDVPVRLFHALIAGGFLAAFVIAKAAEHSPLFVVHMLLGLVLVVATLLRILWGVLGSPYARFSNFKFSPGALVGYFKDLVGARGASSVGHNPATSYAALAIFAGVLGLGVTGVLLARGGGDAFEELHEVFAVGTLTVAVLHVAGVILHAVRHRDGIALSIVNGTKPGPTEAGIASPHWGAGIGGLVVTAATAAWLFAGYNASTGTAELLGTTYRLGVEEAEHGKREDHAEGKRRKRAHADAHREDSHDDD